MGKRLLFCFMPRSGEVRVLLHKQLSRAAPPLENSIETCTIYEPLEPLAMNVLLSLIGSTFIQLNPYLPWRTSLASSCTPSICTRYLIHPKPQPLLYQDSSPSRLLARVYSVEPYKPGIIHVQSTEYTLAYEHLVI